MANYPFYPYGGYQPMQMPQMAPQAPQVGQMGQGGLSPMSRPVSSREEAQATAADFSGAPMVFLDRAHRRVYVKQWNMQTGAADFEEYGLPAAIPEAAAPIEYVSLHTYQADMENLRRELAALKEVTADAE